MSTADSRWVLAQAVTHLPAGNVLFIDTGEIATQIVAQRPDITPIAFSTSREPWVKAPLSMVNGVLLGWSHHKEQVRMMLAMLAEKLPEGTGVWLVGGARSGIASAARLLDDANWKNVHKLAYGGHAELWHAELAQQAPARGIEAWQRRIVQEVAGLELVLVSLPGVFSHGEVDEGTELLLNNMPLLPKGARVHDFGCGCGIIATWLKLRQPDLNISASDINALAHAAAKATLKANRITDVNVHVAAGLGPIDGMFDAIVTNPPFHTGQKIDMGIVDELFKSAQKKLAKGGALYVVANRFLAYREAMAQLIGPVKVLAETPAFWVLKATRT